MKAIKIKSGTYKIEIGNSLIVLQDMSDCMEISNPDKGWGTFSIVDGNINEKGNWGGTHKNKKIALQSIVNDFENGFIK